MLDENTASATQASGTGSDEARGLRRIIWAMTIILVVSLATTLLLAYKVKVLNDSLRALGTSPPPLLQVGASVPTIKASSLEDRQEVISYAEGTQPTVFYIFTPQCLWCTRNLDNLKMLLSQKQGSYRFVGISLTDKDVKDYVVKNRLDIPIYMNPSEEAQREYKLGTTPQTIVVSPDGKVLQNWVGAYTGEQQTQIEKYFGVKLPGITPAR
jgi:peroxiredoxin